MPIYEYRCNDCGGTSSLFFRTVAAAAGGVAAACEHCGSATVERLISRTYARRDPNASFSNFASDRALNGVSDTMERGEFAIWARRMSEDLGESGGARFRELADRTESGEDPVERFDAAQTARYEIDKNRRIEAGLPSQTEEFEAMHPDPFDA
ncbi:MAG: zinc ribbon domain-containing protein [Dehalococcoidia bacterium]|nr:zinc ribbon domain-containing protein [Dehalococcoidia bacterium]